MYRRPLLLVLFSLCVGSTIAQQNLRMATSSISSSNTGNGKFYYVGHNEPPRAIEFSERTVTAISFLSNINRYFNIPTEFTFKEAESNTDDLGMHHRLLLQYYRDILVEGMGYRVHEKDGYVISVNGKAVRDFSLNTEAKLSEKQAFYLAVKYLQTKDTVFRSGKKLVVSKDFTFTRESFALAFQFDIDVSLIERWRISIDAQSGEIINKVSLVNTCFNESELPLPYGTGTGLTNYYGTKTIRIEKFDNGSSRLVGQTENGGMIGTYNFANASIMAWLFNHYKVYDVYSSTNTHNDKVAVSVQWGAEQAFEYFFKKHGRNSYDDKGSAIVSFVHVDNNWNNAAWSRNTLLFGDGSNNNPLVELDVVSHELTHGVTQYEAGLQYYGEPGALNESFSDILGKAAEFYTLGDAASWQLAKHYREGGLRDFSNPNLKNQPDTWLGDMWYTGYEDYGGVHYNSGVQNFWFYLLCEGGSGVNDNGQSYNVQPVGIETAAKIAYRNLTEYLGYSSDYLDSRIGSLLATADLYGKNSTVYQEVANAWDAVGVIDEPIITSFSVYDITATTVKIKGNFLPRGDTATYHFEYGTTPAFGTASSIHSYTNKVEGIITGLQSETKYYLRLVATNENGSSYETTEFTTISLAPLVKIEQTVDVTETSATLHGRVNPNSLLTSFYFEYGPTPSLGVVTPTYPLSDTTEFLNVSASVANLQPRQIYYYRLVASNDFSTTATETISLFTAVKPTINSFTPITASPGAVVTITGQNFNSLPENNLINFGATRGTILSSSPTEIKVKVPKGASLGPITLLDAESGLTTESIEEFVPTFTGEFKKSHLQLRMGSNDYIYQTLVQDMNGDNTPDIVALHYLGFSVFQNVNQGGDITEESFVRSTFNLEYTPGNLSLVDFDGNGLKDIVGRYQGVIRIYPNFSVPGYIFFGVPVDIPATGSLQNIMFFDFDLDGHVDVAGKTVISSDSSLITIIRNQNPKGSLSANNFVPRYTKALPYYVYFLTAGDLNNDGTPDLMTSPYNKNFLSILKNYSHPGSIVFEEDTVEDLTRGRFARYVAHDFNADGWKDVTSHSPYEIGNIAILENKGSSSSINLATPVIALANREGSDIKPGDINGDGKVDLLIGTDARTFVFLENKVKAGEHLSNSSFENSYEYGKPLNGSNSGSAETKMTINDLNGDGRPEIINVYSYYFGPHNYYYMEIWQNAPPSCLDPSLTTVNVSNATATIVLPSNAALDQFEMEYKRSDFYYWNQLNSTTISYLSPGYTYLLRIRAKCYLDFTEYSYINFSTDCVDTNSFYVGNIGANSANFYASNLSSFEIQYSPAGKEQWITLPQSTTAQVSNLSPGTNYDVRFRGRCYMLSNFTYQTFTTLCPKLASLTISDLSYNKATVGFTSNYNGNAILEFSTDNISWTLIDETRKMSSLLPTKEYFVRGRMACTNTNSDFIFTSFTTPCPKVSTLSIDAITPFSARINWADDSGAKSYTLTYSAAGSQLTTVETNSTSFTLDGLRPGTSYSVAVAPQCALGKNFTSTTFSTVCYAPFNLSVNAVTQTTAELSWLDHFNALPYAVDYSISGSNRWLTTETPATHTTLTDLRPGSRYEVRVHINCLSQTAPYVSSFFETGLYEQATFAPNPTDGEIEIYPAANLIGNYFSIHDNTGRLVASGELLDYTMDFSHFSPGIYTLRIEGSRPIRVFRK